MQEVLKDTKMEEERMQSFITLQVRSTKWKLKTAESELKFGVQTTFWAKPSTVKATEGLKRRKAVKSFIIKSGKMFLNKLNTNVRMRLS